MAPPSRCDAAQAWRRHRCVGSFGGQSRLTQSSLRTRAATQKCRPSHGSGFNARRRSGRRLPRRRRRPVQRWDGGVHDFQSDRRPSGPSVGGSCGKVAGLRGRSRSGAGRPEPPPGGVRSSWHRKIALVGGVRRYRTAPRLRRRLCAGTGSDWFASPVVLAPDHRGSVGWPEARCVARASASVPFIMSITTACHVCLGDIWRRC
jgi:hypothetical protein